MCVCVCVCRSLVSASQDGKLIVWDGYTTNKARIRLLTYLLTYLLKNHHIRSDVVLRVSADELAFFSRLVIVVGY